MEREINQRTVRIPVGPRIAIDGHLAIPESSSGIVVFAHGSGSGRHSPRNKLVAEVLNRGGIATLLIDLLTETEEAVDLHTGHLRFKIPFLASRLVQVTDWLNEEDTATLNVGYFGASTGAAAALVAAVKHASVVKAIVSRGGRPDLSGHWLSHVRAPTLFIVGANDDRQVIQWNYQAAEALGAPYRIEIIPRAGHLFAEAGALEKVAALARAWFAQHLSRRTEAA